MAKKSFMNNPAESFFSEAPVATAAQEIFKGTPAAAEPGSPLVTAFIKNREEQTQTEKPAVSPKDDDGMVGRIVSVSSLKVEVFLKKTDICIRDLLYTEGDGVRYLFEVQEIDGSVAAAICCGQTNGLKRGMPVYLQKGGLQIAYDEQILGHVFSSYGNTLDGTRLEHPHTRNISDKSLSMSEIVIDGDILWTGIKVLDFFAPMQKGYKMGFLGGAGVGKTVLIKELIHNVFEFDDLTAGEIATHRTEVDTLWLKDTPEQWAESIHQTRHGLYPVCDGSKDDITGVLRVADYYRLEEKSRENILKHAVKPAYFVPERIKADVLFRNMRAGGHAMAVVVDEYGGMSGVITMKDLIEQLIGEFPAEGEEADAEMPRIIRGEGDCWKIRGNVEMHKLEKALGVQIPGEEFDTFSGFVFGALSRIPEDGTCDIPVEFPLFNVKIQRIGEHQIQEAELMLKK